MNEININYLFYFFILLFFLWLFLPKFKKNKHDKNIKLSKTIINNFKSWEGQYIEARIFKYLRKIDPFVFEEILLSSFDILGADIVRNKRYTGDGGSDGLFFYNKKRYIIQAKRYAGHVSKQHINEFCQLARSYDGGLFIHTGKTPKSIQHINQSNVKIISGDTLIDLILSKTDMNRILNKGN